MPGTTSLEDATTSEDGRHVGGISSGVHSESITDTVATTEANCPRTEVQEKCDATAYCILAFYQFMMTAHNIPASQNNSSDPAAAGLQRSSMDNGRYTPSDQTVQQWRSDMNAFLRTNEARGSVLLSIEGMNGTVCYPTVHDAAVTNFLQNQRERVWGSHISVSSPLQSSSLKLRRSYSSNTVFHRLQVRIKPEIVTMGTIPVNLSTVTEATGRDLSKDSSAESVVATKATDGTATASTSTPKEATRLRPVVTGTYVQPGPEWDALLDDPDCLVIDTRNTYEVQLGTFRNAVNPQTASFTEFPAWLQRQLGLLPNKSAEIKEKQQAPKALAMFCTGGIRCEKATSYCLQLLEEHEGMRKVPVYHLEGGILAYLDTVPESESSFSGECFVFDQRVAVTHGLRPTQAYTACHACRNPISSETKSDPRYVFGASCPKCYVDPTNGNPTGATVELDGMNVGATVETAQTTGSDITVEEPFCDQDNDLLTGRCNAVANVGNNSVDELFQQQQQRRMKRHAERQRQMELAAVQGIAHIHDAKQQRFLKDKMATSDGGACNTL